MSDRTPIIDRRPPITDHRPPITVLLADDQRLMREGLRTLLELHADLRVVGEAADGEEAERLTGLHRPDVVLMDLRMPRRDGVQAIQRIASRWPRTRILVLTTFDDDELVFRSIAAGAHGYLLKDVGSDALAEAIRAAARGESPVQPSIARKLLAKLRKDEGGRMKDEARSLTPASSFILPPSSFPHGLTAREVDVLRLLGGGATNREIAATLSLTEGTVKNYISTILDKTGLHDRTQAALFAVREGLVQGQRPSPPGPLSQ